MGKRYYIPDRSIKNAWIVFCSNRKKRIILSSKSCSTGVTPKGTKYHTIGNILFFLCYMILLFVVQFVFDKYVLGELNRTVRIIITHLIAIVCSIPMIPICIYLSFPFSEWMPAETSAVKTVSDG